MVSVGCTMFAGGATGHLVRTAATPSHAIDVTGGYTSIAWAVGNTPSLAKHAYSGLVAVNFLTGAWEALWSSICVCISRARSRGIHNAAAAVAAAVVVCSSVLENGVLSWYWADCDENRCIMRSLHTSLWAGGMPSRCPLVCTGRRWLWHPTTRCGLSHCKPCVHLLLMLFMSLQVTTTGWQRRRSKWRTR